MPSADWAVGRWRGTVFAVFFGLLALAAVFSHRAYAPFLLLLLLAVDWPHILGRGGALRSRPSMPWLVYGISAATLCGWTLVSALWSPMPEKIDWVWRYGACFLLAALAFSSVHYLTPAARARAGKALAWGVFIMAALLAFEAVTGGFLRRITPPFQAQERDLVSLGRGTLLLVLLVWPAQRVFAAELARPYLGWLTVILAIIPAFTFMIASNAAMLIAGALGVGLAYAVGRRAIAVLLGAIVVALWVTPVLAMVLPLESWAAELDWLPTTWTQRLYIYARAGAEIFAHPFGGGVEYARSLSRPIETVTIDGLDLPTMPLHPHNLFLHVWMDLGVIGALSMTGLVASVWLGFKRIVLTRTEAAMVAGVLAALLVTATTEWSLWQVWRFASVWIAMIGCRLAIGGLPIR